MVNIGPVEKRIYDLREEHPLVIPQIDPNNFTTKTLRPVLKRIIDMNIRHISIGGTIFNGNRFNEMIDIITKDFDLSITLYLTNYALTQFKNVPKKTALFWTISWNAENPFFFKDALFMAAHLVTTTKYEAIPSAYVFDDRGELRSSNWLARAVPVPREKPEISLALALVSQLSGLRFYIMGGGSGSKLAPPEEHIKLIANKTDLFLIPTSGIRTVDIAKKMFESGADAIHIGSLIEEKGGLKTLEQIVKSSQKYPGQKL